MTTQQDVQRAGMRVMMADPRPLPEYTDNSETMERVGKVLGGSASTAERHARASDSSRDKAPDQRRANENVWVISVALCTGAGTAGLLGLLAYWHFA